MAHKGTLSSAFNMSLGFIPVIISILLCELITQDTAIYIGTGMEVCRNARCTSFFVHHYTNLFTFFKLRSFEDFFDLCVPSI